MEAGLRNSADLHQLGAPLMGWLRSPATSKRGADNRQDTGPPHLAPSRPWGWALDPGSPRGQLPPECPTWAPSAECQWGMGEEEGSSPVGSLLWGWHCAERSTRMGSFDPHTVRMSGMAPAPSWPPRQPVGLKLPTDPAVWMSHFPGVVMVTRCPTPLCRVAGPGSPPLPAVQL